MTPKAPSHLSTEAKRWWKKIQHEYLIEDRAGQLLLQTCLESFDRMRSSQKQIEAEGQTIQDRFDQTKAHPLCAVERDSRAAMLSALKALNLDLEPVKDIGRPPGS